MLARRARSKDSTPEWANTVAESLSTRDLEGASRTLAALGAEIRKRSREFP
jgi:hypothetical protein